MLSGHADAPHRQKPAMLHCNIRDPVTSRTAIDTGPRLHRMTPDFDDLDLSALDAAAADADPRAVALTRTLSDCCHPRAERLIVRLLDCRDDDQLALLRGEVLNLLALSFGPAEALRRLQAVQ